MIFDTDVVIWVFRGHEGAADLVDNIADLRYQSLRIWNLFKVREIGRS